MDPEEFAGLTCSVQELLPPSQPSLWAAVREGIETRLPLRSVGLNNKAGNSVSVDRLNIQFLSFQDPRVLRFRPFAHSPVTWFRIPFVHIIVVSPADINEYRAVTRKAIADAVANLEKDWAGESAAACCMAQHACRSRRRAPPAATRGAARPTSLRPCRSHPQP